jgi:hypothetical protein
MTRPNNVTKRATDEISKLLKQDMFVKFTEDIQFPSGSESPRAGCFIRKLICHAIHVCADPVFDSRWRHMLAYCYNVTRISYEIRVPSKKPVKYVELVRTEVSSCYSTYIVYANSRVSYQPEAKLLLTTNRQNTQNILTVYLRRMK